MPAPSTAHRPPKKSDLTRLRLLHVSLDLFRRKGFDAATMRDIAAAADLAPGAAYYYFPSKDAIVMDYYTHTLAEHEQRVRDGLPAATNLQERLTLAMQSKLDLLRNDRPFLQSLFRFAGNPAHPLSVFGSATREQREKSIALFRTVIAGESLPDDLREILPLALWALHLAFILYFVHDDSLGEQRSRRLVTGATTLIAQLIALASAPMVQTILKPVRTRIVDLLRDANLLPTAPIQFPETDPKV